MKINKVSQWSVFCESKINEYCHISDEVIFGDSEVFNTNEAIKEFRKRGWSLGKTNLCPNCKKFKQSLKTDKRGEE